MHFMEKYSECFAIPKHMSNPYSGHYYRQKDTALLSLKTASFQFRFALGSRLRKEGINGTLVH